MDERLHSNRHAEISIRNTMIHLYVEHLLNIRTLSIQAALSTVSNKETKATLSADGATLNLTHEGESACIKLPINLSPKQESKVKITIPAVPSRELSFRVQLEEKDGEERNLLSNVVREGGNVIPWTANSLTDDTEVCCGSCNCVLFERGNIQTWKDLPSEGWAEMMEFWHCHKPHEPHSHLNGDLNKGYAAGSKLAIESGVGLVDVADILFAADDCKNITVGPTLLHSLPLHSSFLLPWQSFTPYKGQKEPALSRRKATSTGKQSGYNGPKTKSDTCGDRHQPRASDGWSGGSMVSMSSVSLSSREVCGLLTG